MSDSLLRSASSPANTWCNKKNVVVGAVATLLLGAMVAVVVVVATPSSSEPSPNRPVGPQELDNFENIWDFAFVPGDSAILYTERCKGLSVVVGEERHLLFGRGDALLPGADVVGCEGQSGVLGLALDPAFGVANRDVFVFFSSDLGGARTNRVARITLAEVWSEPPLAREDVVTDIAYKTAAGPGAHSGGRIRFGLGENANALFITTGDNHNGSLPQDPLGLGGKVLRVNKDGSADVRNLPPPGFDQRIFSYGFRNVQGIDFRPSDGAVMIAEHGPAYSDEVTLLVNGGNGGWDPQNREALDCPDYCGYSGDVDTMPMTDAVRFRDVMPPLWTNRGASAGVGPCVFLTGPQWGQYDGWLAVGVMGAMRIDLLQISESGQLLQTVAAPVPDDRYRSLIQGPDGSLFAATDAGFIRRFTFS